MMESGKLFERNFVPICFRSETPSLCLRDFVSCARRMIRLAIAACYGSGFAILPGSSVAATRQY